MEPEQRSPREMTYQVGWRRGKIVSSPEYGHQPCPSEEQPEASGSFYRLAAGIRRWNGMILWKQAPLPSSKRLLGIVLIMPAALFALFVWMVHLLSRFS